VAAPAHPDSLRPVVLVYLFGFLTDDFMGRVLVTPDDLTVGSLAAQLTAWSWHPDQPGAVVVLNEAGDVLDPASTIAQAGLGNGDICTVRRGG
jgi:hypothetical protein